MGTRYNRLDEAVLTSTHNLCFVQKYEKYLNFLSENFQFLEIEFSIYLNRRVFGMDSEINCIDWALVVICIKFSRLQIDFVSGSQKIGIDISYHLSQNRGDNLHEISKPIFWEKGKEKYFKMSSDAIFFLFNMVCFKTAKWNFKKWQ